NPRWDNLLRSIEVFPDRAQNTVGGRPYVHRRVFRLPTNDGGHREFCQLRGEFGQELLFELGVLLLPDRMRKLEVRGVAVDRSVPEQRPADDIEGETAQALTGRNPLSEAQIL